MDLADVDWRAGELVVWGKGPRVDRLPLPADVGDAVAAWLRRGRGRCQCSNVFTRVRAPRIALTSGGISDVVYAACRRVGIPEVSADRLRHTAATEMLRSGSTWLKSARSFDISDCSPPRSTRRSTDPPCPRSPCPGRGVRDERSSSTLDDYLVLRRGLGFKLERAGRLLAQFVDFCEDTGVEIVTVEAALAWATAPQGCSRCGELTGSESPVPSCVTSTHSSERGAADESAPERHPPGYSLPLLVRPGGRIDAGGAGHPLDTACGLHGGGDRAARLNRHAGRRSAGPRSSRRQPSPRHRHGSQSEVRQDEGGAAALHDDHGLGHLREATRRAGSGSTCPAFFLSAAGTGSSTATSTWASRGWCIEPGSRHVLCRVGPDRTISAIPSP